LDGTPIEGEFSVRRVCTFVPRRGGQLERDQKEWEEQHRDDQDEEELEEEPKGDVVQTPLFAEGEHGIGVGNQGARGSEAPDTSYNKCTITS
jgi:hypothetical protein